MGKNATNHEKKQFYIPLEITDSTIITEDYRFCKIRNSKIGNRPVRTILIPATEEQYYAFMRPEWREDKRRQRHAAQETSTDWICDAYELEPESDFNLEEAVLKRELLTALQHELAALKEIDRIILQMFSEGCSERTIGYKVGMSQKGVNKRKHRLLELLREDLKGYR
jgi:DNA-binding CsgD family transcriptional regulator|nr:MAG TPA: RNA polymerase sigma factor [Caudoviricetes sp.]